MTAATPLHYVLDTNVLLLDPFSLFHFKEHNIHLPLAVLEELDKHKKGTTDLARNARQVTRILGELVTAGTLDAGFPLAFSAAQATGRLFLQKYTGATTSSVELDVRKMDNQILIQTLALAKAYPDSVVLVTNDINLQVKAMALGLRAQEYRKGRVIGDEDLLPVGFEFLPDSFWEDNDDVACKVSKSQTQLTLEGHYAPNTFLLDGSRDGEPVIWQVQGASTYNATHSTMQSVRQERRKYLTPQNVGQKMANHLLYDKNLDLVTLLGKAGTGKTLLALAAGLEQVQSKAYERILITRATVPLGDDIGFLPGTEADKMAAWLGGVLEDCFLALGLPQNAPERSMVTTASMSFMRGRSFQKTFVIVDEAQNLSKQTLHSLITRSGAESKVVLTGNLSQIDTPFLDESTSGLTWAVKTFYPWGHAGHLILPESVRSRLAAYAESADSPT